MRYPALLALAVTLAVPHAVHARLFWQTYGASVASPNGCGCAWNLNSDYFVPRHCDSGRYDLFSPCKTAHSISPACKNLHPVHGGYCTPYGECHYRWRDHVYRKYCGCTPLKHIYGPWRLDKCRKHGLGPCGCSACTSGRAVGVSPPVCDTCQSLASPAWNDANGDVLPNVEPFGGETLGTILAFPAGNRGGMGGGAMMPTMSGMQGASGMSTVPTGQTLPPPLDFLPGVNRSSSGLPPSFGN
jgi:hypothetical protein